MTTSPTHNETISYGFSVSSSADGGNRPCPSMTVFQRRTSHRLYGEAPAGKSHRDRHAAARLARRGAKKARQRQRKWHRARERLSPGTEKENCRSPRQGNVHDKPNTILPLLCTHATKLHMLVLEGEATRFRSPLTVARHDPTPSCSKSRR